MNWIANPAFVAGYPKSESLIHDGIARESRCLRYEIQAEIEETDEFVGT